MKNIIFGALAVTAAIQSLVMPAQAQSSRSNSTGEASSLSGTSLVGVDNRSSGDDFAKFFGLINPENTQPSTTQKNPATPIRFNQTLTLPDTPVFLEPVQESLGGTDGVQVQVDLTGLDRPAQK
ncbi:hypothetical protein NIES4071_95650 [Calothrix sp. NIES-4071]|nr:hypothetical protein NIES4071_95650 [Calothrix sp. NIES-4071]BAZ63830.1 hypothetical protein NIES4105_95580 [Calothrix sp. NIES-4105]